LRVPDVARDPAAGTTCVGRAGRNRASLRAVRGAMVRLPDAQTGGTSRQCRVLRSCPGRSLVIEKPGPADDKAAFGTATAARSLGDGTFAAELPGQWAIGTHPHGGFLMALVARVAAARAGEHGEVVEPLVVSSDFLRPPAVGPVLLRTEVRKL